MFKKIIITSILSCITSSIAFATIRGEDRRAVNEKIDDRIEASASGIHYVPSISDTVSRSTMLDKSKEKRKVGGRPEARDLIKKDLKSKLEVVNNDTALNNEERSAKISAINKSLDSLNAENNILNTRFKNGRLNKALNAKNPSNMELSKKETINRLWEKAVVANPGLVELSLFGIPRYTFVGYFKAEYDKATTVAEKKKYLDLLIKHFE